MPSEFYLKGKQQNNNQPQSGSNPPAQPPVSQPTTSTNTSGLSDFYRQGKQQLQQTAQPTAAPTQPKGWWDSITQGASDAGKALYGAGELLLTGAKQTFGNIVGTTASQEVSAIPYVGTANTKNQINRQIENLNAEIQLGKKIERNALEEFGQSVYNAELPIVGGLRNIVEGVGAVLPQGTPPAEQLKARKERLNEELKIYEENAKFTNNKELVERTKNQLKGIDAEIAFWEEEDRRQKSGEVSQITANLYADRPNLTEEEKLEKIKEVQRLQEELRKIDERNKKGETIEGQLENYGLSNFKDVQQQRKEIRERFGNPEFYTPTGILFGLAENGADIVEGLGTGILAAYSLKKGKVKTAAALSGISLTTNYGNEFGNIYNQAILEGSTPLQAKQAARIYAPISVAISKVGLSDKLSQIKISKLNADKIENELQRRLVTGGIRRTKAGLGEVIEENSQDLVATAVSEIYKDNPEWFEGADQTSVVSFIFGFLLSGRQNFDENDGITLEQVDKANKVIDKALDTPVNKRTAEQQAIVEEVKDNAAVKELKRSNLTGEPLREIVVDGENVSERVREAFAPTTTPTEGFVTPPETQPMVTPEQPATTPQVTPTTTTETKPTVTPTPTEKPAKKSIKQVKKETKPKVAKLKDAEETLKQDVTLYRGGKGTGFSTLVRGKYFGDNEQLAKQFGDISETSTLPKGTKVFNLDLIKENPNQTIVPKEMLVDTKALTKFLLDKGYTVTKNTTSRGGVEYVMLGDKDIDVQNIAKRFKNQAEFLNYLATDKGQKELKDKGITLKTGEATAAWNLSQGLDYKGKKVEKEAPKKKLGEKKVEKKEIKKPVKKVGEKKVVTKQPNPITVKAGTVFDQSNIKEATQNKVDNAHKVMQNAIFGKEVSSSQINKLKITYLTNEGANSRDFKKQLKLKYTPVINLLSINPDTPKVKSFQTKLQSILKTIENGKFENDQVIADINKVLYEYDKYIENKIEKYVNKRTPKFRLTDNVLFNEGTQKLTTRTEEVLQTFKKDTLSKQEIDKFLKDATTKYGISKEEIAIIKELLDTEFKNDSQVSIRQLNQKIIEELLPIQIFEKDTTIASGQSAIFNMGRTSLNMDDSGRYLSKVIVLNSPYDHKRINKHLGGRFGIDFYENQRKELIRTNPELADTLPEGLFSWFRVIEDTKTGEIYILEMQSDPFQDTVTDGADNIDTTKFVNKQIEALKKNIEGYQNDIAELKQRIADREESLRLLNQSEPKTKNLIKAREEFINDHKIGIEKINNNIDYAYKQLEKDQKKLNDYLDYKPTKLEKMHMTYLATWHERSIKEILRYYGDKGATAVNFPTPLTLGVVERHVNWNPNPVDKPKGEKYKVLSAKDKNNLEVGDVVEFEISPSASWTIITINDEKFTAVDNLDFETYTKENFKEKRLETFKKDSTVDKITNIWKNIYGIEKVGDLKTKLVDIEKVLRILKDKTEAKQNATEGLERTTRFLDGAEKRLVEKKQQKKDALEIQNDVAKIETANEFDKYFFDKYIEFFKKYSISTSYEYNFIISFIDTNRKVYESGAVTSQEYVDANIYKDYDSFQNFLNDLSLGFESETQKQKFKNTVKFIYDNNYQNKLLKDLNERVFNELNSKIDSNISDAEGDIGYYKQNIKTYNQDLKDLNAKDLNLDEELKQLPQKLQDIYKEEGNFNNPAFDFSNYSYFSDKNRKLIKEADELYGDYADSISLEKLQTDITQKALNYIETSLATGGYPNTFQIPNSDKIIVLSDDLRRLNRKEGLTPETLKRLAEQKQIKTDVEKVNKEYLNELTIIDTLNQLSASMYISETLKPYVENSTREYRVTDPFILTGDRNIVFKRIFNNETYKTLASLFPPTENKTSEELLNETILKIRDAKDPIKDANKSISEIILDIKNDEVNKNRDVVFEDLNPTLFEKGLGETELEKNQLRFIGNYIRTISNYLTNINLIQTEFKDVEVKKQKAKNYTEEELKSIDKKIQDSILKNFEVFLTYNNSYLISGLSQRAPIGINYKNKYMPFFAKYGKNTTLTLSPSDFPFIRKVIDGETIGKIKAYRKSQDAQITRQDVTDEQVKTIKKLNKKIFGDENVKFVQNILASMDALGAYGEDFVYILSGQAQPTDTWLHEAVHKYIDIFMTPAEQKALLKEAIIKYKTTDMAVLEEHIAEDFIAFANARIQKTSTLLGKIQDFFEKLFVRTNSYFENLDAINKLYEEILSGKAAKIKAEREKAKKKTAKLGEKKAAQAPPEKKKLGAKKMPKVEAPSETVGGGKVKKSRFMERLNEQLLGTNPEAFGFNDVDGTYNVANLERESERAINFIEADPMRALNIALGNESAPAGYLENTIEVAVALRLKQLGNLDLYKQVLVRNSLKNTRRGQEIASLRGQFNDNSAENYIKRALDARLNKLGDKFAGGLGQRATMLGLKKSNKKEVFERIQKEKVELKKVIKDAKKIKSAQDIIDSLRC